MLHSALALLPFEHLQIHAKRLLDGVFVDEVDKVLEVSLPAGHQLVDGRLPHHGLGELSGVVCEVSRRIVSSTARSPAAFRWILYGATSRLSAT